MQEKAITKRWRAYFRDLLNEQNESQLDETAKVEGPLEITKKEVETALRQVKNGQAPVPTGVMVDQLTAAGKEKVKELTNINKMLGEEGIAEDRKRSTTIPTFNIN